MDRRALHDYVTSSTTPSPGNGQRPQTTSMSYEVLGQVWKTTLPDGTSVTNEFFGNLARKRRRFCAGGGDRRYSPPFSVSRKRAFSSSFRADSGVRRIGDTGALTPSLSHRMGEGARRAGEGSVVVYPTIWSVSPKSEASSKARIK